MSSALGGLTASMLGLCVASCGRTSSSSGDGIGNASGAVPSIEVPTSYTGTIPCADCPGIGYQLDLLPGDVYFLRREYLDRDAVNDAIGTWAISRDEAQIVLQGEDQMPSKFQILSVDRLRLCDIEGRPIESDLNYEIVRSEVSLLEPELEMTGMYRYFADAGRFAECLTGLAVPVAHEGDNARLERNYSEMRAEDGSPIKALVRGQLAMRPQMEGDGLERHLVVDEFRALYPGETCGARGSISSLEGTYWKLTRLGNDPVLVEANGREPSLVLESAEHRVTGSGGCNRFFGSYTLEGSTISFGEIGSTKMACAALDIETRFFEALGRAQGYRLLAHHLELYDGNGEIVARFEARELR